jgi:ABC-2 type transport system ATP-binding protein
LGYRQRVGLAQALIHDPKIVILDEPTSGLDPMQIISIRRLIKDLAKAKTIIFSTHILQEASAVSDRLLIIDRGKIISEGTVNDLKKEKQGMTHFTVAVQAARLEVEEVLHNIITIKDFSFSEENHRTQKFICTTTSYDESARSLTNAAREKNWFIREMAQKELSLEEVFLALFKKSGQNA